MGRPGTGGSGSHSSGGHSVGRTSGGHRVGGNSRPGMNVLNTQHSRSTGNSGGSGFGSGLNSKKHDSGLDFGQIMTGMMMVDAVKDSLDRESERRREQDREERRERECEREQRIHEEEFLRTSSDSGSLNSTKQPKTQKCQEQQPEFKKRDYIKYIGIAVFAIWFILFIFFDGMIGSKNTNPVSTKNRVKLDHPVAYDNNNIIDELGYIDDKAKLSRNLQNFYDITGIMPYIVLKSYDANLTSDKEKTEYANRYYADHITNEGSMLYMYFAEQDESKVGYMSYVNGTAVKSVMDAEAVTIFWNYLDTYWVDENLSMDDVFVKTFDKTAKTIMTKSKTKEDVAFTKYIVLVVVCSGVILLTFVVIAIRRKQEKALETERILNTPLSKMDDAESDDLASKYL